MTYNGLSPKTYGGFESVEDNRWRKNREGMGYSGQNLTLVIDDAAKAEGDHRLGRWLKSGVPIYRDEDNKGHIFTADAKTAGSKIAGFLQGAVEIADRDGVFYDQVSTVGIQTAGEIYPQWLPVDVAAEDIPARFGVSPL